MAKREVWVNDNSNAKYQRLKASFVQAMIEQTKDQRINYYDFLLVAKKMSFRFEQSSHLMSLKNYFARNKNSVAIKKMGDLLCISQQSLHVQQQKIIVKFTVPETQFAPIKEQTHQDEQDFPHSQDELGEDIFEKIGGGDLTSDQQKQLNQKMAIILSIKVDQMEKKIKSMLAEKDSNNLIVLLRDSQKDKVTYQEFRDLVIHVLGSLRQRVKMSEQDIKTIFYVMDTDHTGTVNCANVQTLREGVGVKLRQFYRTRINRQMVKNTLFKLGKVKSNAIQIYQVKNASLLEFENIEKAIVQDPQPVRNVLKLKPAKLPHFGPLKGAAIANRQRMTMPPPHSEYRSGQPEIKLQRQRIEKILRVSKQQKRRDKKGETVASKLRSLFIHKVILPREKMLQQQKQRYQRNKGVENELTIKPSK